jgi:predicted ArsR family transcriptional regulator
MPHETRPNQQERKPVSDYYSETLADMPLFAAKQAPAQQHSVTSMQAADSLDARALTRLHRLVLDFLRGQTDGATDEEIASGLGLNPNTERPRRIELARRGLVVEAGTRKTASGRNATTWRTA